MNLEFNKNEDVMRRMLSAMNKRLEKIHEGGGKARIEKEHEKGKLTARERIALLTDKNSKQIEIGAFAGEGMYADHGGCPAGGVVIVIGYVSGRQCVIVANDATVKAGAWFPISGKKNLRAQEIAMENRLPIIYLVDSAGVYLPMQDEIFPDKEHFGRIFRNNAVMSGMGIVQVSAIMGSCVAGGAYLPIMSDEALIVNKTGTIFLAGPYLVKAAVGEDIDNETLGGATTHCEISGVTDYKCDNDENSYISLMNQYDDGLKDFGCDINMQIELDLKYSGYISRQNSEIERLSHTEKIVIPSGFNFNEVVSNHQAEIVSEVELITRGE